MEIFIMLSVVLGILGGLFIGYMEWYHPCNHTWTLLEKREFRISSRNKIEDVVKSVYTCSRCGRIKKINF